MKCAITFTVKNINDLLYQNIKIHRKLGISHFFVFIDDEAAKVPKRLQKVKDVTCRKNVTSQELNHKVLTKKFKGKYQSDYNIRRHFNTMWAAQQCEKKNFGWIASIDPDELICGDLDEPKKASIKQILLKHKNAPQIRLTCYESYPYTHKKNKSFGTVTEFVKEPGYILRKIPFLKPIDGHIASKVIFNVTHIKEYIPAVHRWTRIDNNFLKARLDTRHAGYLLHYFHYDFETFKEKMIYRGNRSKKISLQTGFSHKEYARIKQFPSLTEEQAYKLYKELISNKSALQKGVIRSRTRDIKLIKTLTTHEKRNSEPLVSIIMPIYNGEKYCEESIHSVLTQTYQNFELLIVDDGSTDNTKNIIHAFNDNRIRIYSHKVNKGISNSLNHGISKANGTYIARLDADDIMLKNRLSEQVAYLNKFESIGVVGSYVEYFGSRRFLKTYPTTNAKLKNQMQYISPFSHPAIMLRKSILDKKPYNPTFDGIEDLDLWWRLSDKTKFATIPAVLTRYRIHDESITTKSLKKMIITSSKYRLQKTTNIAAKIVMITLITLLCSPLKNSVVKILLFLQQHNGGKISKKECE